MRRSLPGRVLLRSGVGSADRGEAAVRLKLPPSSSPNAFGGRDGSLSIEFQRMS